MIMVNNQNSLFHLFNYFFLSKGSREWRRKTSDTQSRNKRSIALNWSVDYYIDKKIKCYKVWLCNSVEDLKMVEYNIKQVETNKVTHVKHNRDSRYLHQICKARLTYHASSFFADAVKMKKKRMNTKKRKWKLLEQQRKPPRGRVFGGWARGGGGVGCSQRPTNRTALCGRVS